jgi:hypothetical protein
MSPRRNALAGLVVAGAVTVAGIAPAGASPPGPGGNGIPTICVPVPGASVTTPAGGPLYGFVYGPPAYLGRVYDNDPCAPN